MENLLIYFLVFDYKINEVYVKIFLIGLGMRDMLGVVLKVFMIFINLDILFY